MSPGYSVRRTPDGFYVHEPFGELSPFSTKEALGTDSQPPSLSCNAPISGVPLSILVVDDSNVFRRITVNFLKDCPEFKVVGEASSFSEAIEKIAKLNPAVTIMDVHMPNHENLNGEDIRKGCEKSRVLAVSLFNDEVTAQLAAQFGAFMLLEKANLGTELVPTLRKIGSGPAN